MCVCVYIRVYETASVSSLRACINVMTRAEQQGKFSPFFFLSSFVADFPDFEKKFSLFFCLLSPHKIIFTFI